MANIKKYNPDSQNWETWASNSATGVYSDNPTLLPEDENSITVEDALIRDREDIELMKKNISWLALHGGRGGSGGSGSSEDVTNSIEILDDSGTPSTELIWKPTSKSIRYIITSSKASNRFKVTATLDGYTIYSETGVAQGSEKRINIAKINAYSSSIKHTLRISIVDNYDNVVSTRVSITETVIKLDQVIDNYTVNINEITEGITLSINYQSSIIGNYVLYWGTSSDIDNNADSRLGWKELNIISSSASGVAIPYWADTREDRLLENSNVRSGQTLTFYFILMSKTDSSIKSNVLEIKSTVVSPDEIAIQPISLSSQIDEISKISKASVMSCNFIVYLSSSSLLYNYTITATKIHQDSQTEEWIDGESKLLDSGTGKYSYTTVVLYNSLSRDDFFEGGNIYRIDIFAQDNRIPSKNNTASCYVEIQSAADSVIPLNADFSKVFDFHVFGGSGLDTQNWVWTNTNSNFMHSGESKTVSTTMSFYNMGGKSKLESTHCRLTNKAYAVINKSKLNNQELPWFPTDATSTLSGIIPATIPQFTLSISYYNDFTPDDNRTIFNFGNIVPKTSTNNGSGRGILITNHNFYIKIGPNSPWITGSIQDSIYHEIDIVFGRLNASGEGTATIEVYHNGVLLAFNKDEVRVSDVFGLNRFDEMSIACNKQGLNNSQFTNIKLQTVALYASALNPYQIVCNWINNLVTYELENDSLNTTLLNEKLNSNLITPVTNQDGTKSYECAIWKHDTYDTENWIEINNGILQPKTELWNACPIPIVTLDFSSNNEWTFERFTQSWSNSTQNPATVKFSFYKPFGVTTDTIDIPITVTGQGTTSIGYAIKNLTIDFGETRLFWANQNWFPERKYTLKADVVDSAHVNNACIGKFVNACANNTNLLKETPPMQYFNSNKNSAEFNDLPETALGENGVSIKHTLEGFPVLLLARFLKSDGTVVNKSLGIYSFNLGRDSYYNMGFKILKKFRDTDGQILSNTSLPPVLLSAPEEITDVLDFDAESWEGVDSINCTEKTNNTKTEIDAASNNGYDTSANATMPVELNGYFWSAYEGHIRHFWENKYPEGAQVTNFRKLCQDLVSCPYTKGSSNIEIGSEIYQYNWDGNAFYVPNQNASTISRLQKDSPPFSIPNARFYYVVCLLFGLVDSLGKNLNMRLWKNTHLNNVDPIWYTCFYDMDTAMGIDNAGDEKVEPDVLDEELYNDPELVRKFAYGTYGNEHMYTVRDNKLWGILDHREFKDQYGSSGGVGAGQASNESLYAAVWNYIRINYLKSTDDFMNMYFDNQTEGVGELLYNQDFDVKYINTPESSFMYGDRKAFVRDWINKRIKFLDSYFGYLQQSGSEPYLEDTTIEDCSYNNIVKLTHNSGTNYLPVVTNTPCIVTTVIGTLTKNSYYVPANTPTEIKVANSIGTPGIQTQINNADLLLEIQDLSDLHVQAIEPTETKTITNFGNELYTKQYGSLSSFSKFNLSRNLAFRNNAIDFIKLFKTWNNGDKTLPYTLTELNLSNTKNSSVTNFSLNLTSRLSGPNGETYYQNPFENLTDIDISNSCVTSVALPENIALNTLKINGSSIENLDLVGQSILKSIDFSGCNALVSVNLDKCSAFETFNLAGTPLLESITISECASLSDISIDMNGCERPISIYVEEVPNLRRVSILNVRNPESQISITASNLEELNLSGCLFESFELNTSCYESLQHLDISNSTVKVINWVGEGIEQGYQFTALDLSECPALVAGGINIENNPAIENIQLPNIENDPVTLNFSFNGCTNLTRIFGNLKITQTGAFNGCSKFKIHGKRFGPDDDHIYDTKPYDLQLYLDDYYTEYHILKDEFQDRKGATNLIIDVENASNMFRNTSVDAFDVYYVLRHLSDNVRNISGMFRGCKNIEMNCLQMDNSPDTRMFEKCGNITNVSYLFYDCSNMGPFKVRGYRYNASYNTHSPGLFTPLINCTNFENIFGLSPNSTIDFIVDKNVFTLPEGQYFGGSGAVVNINQFRPKGVYTNGNGLDQYKLRSIFGISGNNATVNNERGNLKGFFSGISKLPSSLNYVLSGLNYLNFGNNNDANGNGSDTMDRIPLEVTSLSHCFSASTTVGTVNLQRIFTKNENDEYDITSIQDSFNGSSSAEFMLNNDTLKGFTNLKTWSNSFTGIDKQIEGSEFPYDILDDCRNIITTFSGFFNNCNSSSVVTTVELPGTLFHDCVKLENISGCFRHFGLSFKLVPGGFTTCPNLHNVSNLFSDCTNSSYCVPAYFFDTGFVNIDPIVITGATVNEKVKEFNNVTNVTNSSGIIQISMNDNGVLTMERYKNVEIEEGQVVQNGQFEIKCNPTSTYSQEITSSGNTTYVSEQYVFADSDWEPSTITIEQRIPRSTINDISYCFSHSYFPPYEYDLGEITTQNDYIEKNPDYCPFDYVKEDGTWRIATRVDKQFTFMWVYDGDSSKLYDTGNNVPIVDMSNYDLDDDLDIINTQSTVSSASIHYIYPPDLFRWCTSNPNVRGIFIESNLRGRLCPYWFKPIPQLSSIRDILNQSAVTAYSTDRDSTSYITIPTQWFKYAPNVINLQSAFSNMTFYSGGPLSHLFSPLKGVLNISSIFANCVWSGGSSTNKFQLSGLFVGNKFSDGSCFNAFDNSYSHRHQYVSFNNMFPKSGTINHPLSADKEVFYGYYDGEVDHEPVPTCNLDRTKRNYAFYGQ